MVQLVGYYMWQSAERRGSALIERTNVERGVEDAVVAFGEAICAPVMDGFAPAQRDFVNNSSWQPSGVAERAIQKRAAAADAAAL